MGVSKIFYGHPYLGKIPILTDIFQRGWNHQLNDQPLENSEVVSTKTVRWCFSVRNLWDSPPSSQCHTRATEILPDGKILISTCISKRKHTSMKTKMTTWENPWKSPLFNRKCSIYLFILLLGFSSHSLIFRVVVKKSSARPIGHRPLQSLKRKTVLKRNESPWSLKICLLKWHMLKIGDLEVDGWFFKDFF